MPEHLSGTVRFSVESLLYHAPKITRTGETLADMVSTAQRRLIDLGDFFGKSWPDKPFRDGYPRCQYAMLIIARQVAEEIQGIGGGIAEMARTYGIAEDQNAADIRKIQGDEAAVSARISHSGGLPKPPSVAGLKPAASKSANPFERPAPDPTSNPVAVPPSDISTTSAAVPAEITSASFTARPSSHPVGPVMPDPQPGVDPTTWQRRDAGSLLGPWPSGDPHRMNEAARYWSDLTAALDEAWTDLQRYTAAIIAEAEGPAAETFRDYADKLIGKGHGLLSRAIEMGQDLQKTCVQQAENIFHIKKQLEVALIEIGATFVIGQVLSVLTFGDAEGLTIAVEASVTERVANLAKDAYEISATLARVLDATAEGMGKIAGAAVAGGLQSAVIGGADVAATNAIGKAFGEKPVEGADALKAVAVDGAVGMILGQGSASGLLGLSTEAAAGRLRAIGQAIKTEADGERSAGPALIKVAEQLKSGSITVSAANAAATQLITQHEITPLTFITGTIANRFTTAISPGMGRHTRP